MNGAIYEEEKVSHKTIDRFMKKCPYLFMLLFMMVMPLMTLLAVSVSTAVITLPLSLLFGWI